MYKDILEHVLQNKSEIMHKDNMIGMGSDAIVYNIRRHKDFVLRVKRFGEPVDRAPIFYQDMFEGRNFGQKVVDIDGITSILKKQIGISIGMPWFSIRRFGKEESEKMYLSNLREVSRMPISAFSKLKEDIEFLNNRGFIFDACNSNNILKYMDVFNIVDIHPIKEGEEFNDIKFDIERSLLNYQFTNKLGYTTSEMEVYHNKIKEILRTI